MIIYYMVIQFPTYLGLDVLLLSQIHITGMKRYVDIYQYHFRQDT